MDVRRTYKKLKGIRSKIKNKIEKAERYCNVKNNEKINEIEHHTKNLTSTKTLLRKKFEKITKKKGPYSNL